MSVANYRSKAHLFIVSHKTPPDEICGKLGIRCDETILKGSPNLSGKPDRHPFNIIIFHSQVNRSLDMAKHAEDLLGRLLPIRSKIRSLPKSCSATLNFQYRMSQDGGWSFSPSILRAIAKLGLPCVFTLDLAKVKEPAPNVTGKKRKSANLGA